MGAPFPHCALPMKICVDRRFLLRQPKLRPAQLEALHHKRHIPPQRAHGLQTLRVLRNLLRRISIHHVPVLAGGDGHAGNGEILVQHIEGRCIAAAAAGNHRRAHFHGLIYARRAEKQPVQEGNRAARR